MSIAPPGGQDRIMIYGPKSDGTYIIEFCMADGAKRRKNSTKRDGDNGWQQPDHDLRP